MLQYRRRSQGFGTTWILWETSEVTRVWAAIRTKAVGQSPLRVLTHRIREQAHSYSIRVVLMVSKQRRYQGLAMSVRLTAGEALGSVARSFVTCSALTAGA